MTAALIIIISFIPVVLAAIAGLLRGPVDFASSVARQLGIETLLSAYDERRKGFSEREAGDFLDLEDLNLARSSEPQSPVPPVISIPPIVRWPGLDAVVDAEVSHEDLAAHITATRIAWLELLRRGETTVPTVSDEIARDLLSDYHITRKK
ncbi:hypothetical protein SEA_BIG3_90 [Mycobacterium phage Big3]|nr:hypothetical protein SEA_BIG3_90 [Mycobacterium phage Big3]